MTGRFPSDLHIGGELATIPSVPAFWRGTTLARLFALHDGGNRARYDDLKQLAGSQKRVLAGSPGTLKRRERRGTEYWVREYTRADGAKDDEHLGTVKAVDAARLDALREEMALARALAEASSRLRLLGYQRVERKPAGVLAALYNRELFRAGLVLIGSHAYGVLLNECGIAAAAYRTQDIDVARAQPLQLVLPGTTGFRDLLNESGLEFNDVPGMPSHRQSGSFKLRGADALAVDLLAPGEALGKVVAVPELRAHAQTIPLLDFLSTDAMDAVVLSPNQQVPVRVPSPARYALHKLYSSQRRGSQHGKSSRDLDQAAVLVAALEAEMPGLLADAAKHIPSRARSSIKRGAAAALRRLADPYAEGRAFLERLAGA
jgi:hypothetical protein